MKTCSGRKASCPWAIFGLIASVWLLALPFCCLFGQYDLQPPEVANALASFAGFLTLSDSDSTSLLICRIRLGRNLLALLCGGALGLAGATLQGVLRNPLADPFTLGISAGAACGASLAIVCAAHFAFLANIPQNPLIAAAALAGALLALFTALFLGRGEGQFSRENVILAGVAVASFLGALVALVKSLNEESVSSIVFWILGSLQGRGFGSAPIVLATLLPGAAAIILGWRKLDILSLGDEAASQLGIRLGPSRFWLLGGASLMTAGCVAVCGVIGFVGLVVPHIFRLLRGPSHGPLLCASFLCGGLFLLAADCVARAILPGGQELPVGVVTALAGGPFFALLVWKNKK